jgi:predicted GNAT family acetyltransferase
VSVTDVPSSPDPDVEVRDNPEDSRYELTLDGEVVGFSEYRDREGRRIFVHTIVDPAYGGRGLGNRLAKAALDDALARDMPVVARCPFIRAWIERHPDYAERLATPAP